MARMVRMLFLAALVALPVPMALASHKSTHGAVGGSAVTEDNDSDGVANNIADAGDNKHPSGKDKSVEKGGSGNQGNSQSDPDGMENGGADKPGGTGGEDLLDQDGNNGCGNDDDFEDDNNGWCGKPVENQRAPSSNQDGGNNAGGIGAGGVGSVGVVRGGTGPDLVAVLGELLVRGNADQAAEVLGVVIGRGAGGVGAEIAASGGSLASTGVPAAGLVALGLTLLGTGAGLRRAGRPKGRHRAR